MPRRFSTDLGGGRVYFVVSNYCKLDKLLFRTRSDYQRFMTILARLTRQTTGISVLAYLLTPNSYHLIISQDEEALVSKFMHRVGVSYAMYFQTKYNLNGKLFKGPYKERVLNDDDNVIREICYLHLSIRKDNVSPEKYEWSSYHKYLSNQAPWLNKDLLKNYLKSQNLAYDLRYLTDSLR